jgi:hypothetical protein
MVRVIGGLFLLVKYFFLDPRAGLSPR